MPVDVRLAACWKQLVRVARAYCAVPDYEAWLAHCREHHPERTPVSRAQFHRDREAARYARGRNRCC